MKRLRRPLTAGVLLSGISCLAQSVKQEPFVDVRKVMTAAEFQEAGLSKLSPEELRVLNLWLSQYAVRILNGAVKTQQAIRGEASASPDVIETYIDGTFEGWDGETIFKMDNGQIWQQSSYAYIYHYAYHPKVPIYRTGSGYKIKVDGVSDTISVTRIK